MYNERTRQTENINQLGGVSAPRKRINQSVNDLQGDIPFSELINRESPARRRCDGTLRDDVERRTQDGCTRATLSRDVDTDSCENGRCGGWGLENHPLAMVYSPCQAWREAYTPEVALTRGTMFSELDLPLEAANKRGCM